MGRCNNFTLPPSQGQKRCQNSGIFLTVHKKIVLHVLQFDISIVLSVLGLAFFATLSIESGDP